MVAASEDYGKKASYVERLIKTFDSFLAGEERDGLVSELADRLAAE